MHRAHKPHGFTIVELLIVVIVISILATITVVTFNGLVARANNSAVRADIAGVSKAIKLFQGENGRLPAVIGGSGGEIEAIRYKTTKSAYSTTVANFIVCFRGSWGSPAPSEPYGIAAQSRDGTIHAWRSDRGFFDYTGVWGGTEICGEMVTTTFPVAHQFVWGRNAGAEDPSRWRINFR